ncbi:hypothetical protein [Streptomyces sp. NPDC058457]|uniref:hypothetical protein n=1 Tax=Streptomyces sp. NPDC058457 TaxID=3346507 RepID=UPI00364B8B64
MAADGEANTGFFGVRVTHEGEPVADEAGGHHGTPATSPVSLRPLDDLQIAELLLTLGIRNGDARPHIRGKLREYMAV